MVPLPPPCSSHPFTWSQFTEEVAPSPRGCTGEDDPSPSVAFLYNSPFHPVPSKMGTGIDGLFLPPPKRVVGNRPATLPH